MSSLGSDVHRDVQRLREDNLAPFGKSVSDPTISQVEALRTRSSDGTQLCNAVACVSHRPAGCRYQGLTDATAFVDRIDKQSPDTAAARIAGRQSCDDAVLFPNVDRPVNNVPFVIRDRDSVWIGKAVLANRPTNLDQRDIKTVAGRPCK